MSCNHVGCEKPEEFFPTLIVHPKIARHAGKKGARITIKLGLCGEHAKGTAEQFITEPLWRMIKGAFIGLKKKPPHRASTEIEFLYIATERWKDESLFTFEPPKQTA